MTVTFSAAVALGRAARLLLLVALAALTVAAWVWLLPMHMAPMSILRTGMPANPMPWSGSTAIFMFVMWSVMMAGMMIPSALPMIFVHDRVARGQSDAHPVLATIAFAVAYVVVWTGFSALATAAQWLLERGRLTRREAEILNAIARGFTYAETAELLHLSAQTVHTHLKNVYKKLAVHSKTEAVFEADRRRLL